MEVVLNTLSKKLPKYDDYFIGKGVYINSGGCGIFAYLLARKLETLNVSHEVVLLVSNECQIKNLNKVLKRNNRLNARELGAHVYWVHLMIKIDNRLVDSTGVYIDLNDTKWGRYITSTIPMETLTEMVNSEAGWNPRFEWESIPTMDKELKKIFTGIKRSLTIKRKNLIQDKSK